MKKIILIVATILLTVACSKDENEPKNPTVNNEPFTFLKVGNEWEYGNYHNYTHNGEFELSDTYTIELVPSENDYFKLKRIPEISPYTWWNMDANAWYEGAGGYGSGIKLPKNCYVGLKFNEWELGYSEVVSVSETVIVPAGIFKNCIKIKVPNYGKGEYHWYHKNYGLIMLELENLMYKLHSTNF